MFHVLGVASFSTFLSVLVLLFSGVWKGLPVLVSLFDCQTIIGRGGGSSHVPDSPVVRVSPSPRVLSISWCV